MKKFNTKMTEKLNDLLMEIIAETEDSYTDEILCDMCQDPEKLQEAFEYLLELAVKEGYVTN